MKVGDKLAIEILTKFQNLTSGKLENGRYPGPEALNSALNQAIDALNDRLSMGMSERGVTKLSEVRHNKRVIGHVIQDPLGRIMFLAEKRRLTFGALLTALSRFFALTDNKDARY